MKAILRCYLDFILPDDFDGTVPEAMRLAADYLENDAGPGTPGAEIDSPEKSAARTTIRNEMLTKAFELTEFAAKKGHRTALLECAVHRFNVTHRKWERTADEMVVGKPTIE